MQEKITPISELGEFALIDHLTKGNYQRNSSTLKMQGDDSAQVYYGADQHTVVSTDMLVHGVHFDLSYFPPMHLGHKAVVSGISDIYAMNAKAEQILLSVAASSKISVEFLEEFYQGVYAACDEYGVDLIGGDTTTVHRGLILNVTALGKAPEHELVFRKGAQEDDLLCVTGDTGAAYLGLQLLEREKQVFHENPEVQPELKEEYSYLYQRFLRPDARNDVIRRLRDQSIIPTSMMDVSDGLSSEILHICKQSGVGCHVYENKLPLHPSTVEVAEQFKLHPTTCALNGGEDYELLFTVPLSLHDKISSLKDVSIIGHITPQSHGTKLVTPSNQSYDLVAQGWQSFGNGAS